MKLPRRLKRAFQKLKPNRVMNKIVNLFKKTHDDDNPPYPLALERHYRISKKVLGVGSFAVVKECTDRATNQPFALKIILKKAIQGKEHMLTTELDVLKKVRHRHIVSMHDLFESKDAVYIIADLASGGELFQQLLEKGSYTEKDASNLVRQILDGVAYLHERDLGDNLCWMRWTMLSRKIRFGLRSIQQSTQRDTPETTLIPPDQSPTSPHTLTNPLLLHITDRPPGLEAREPALQGQIRDGGSNDYGFWPVQDPGPPQ
ncbi:kinase-like domain-containing protein [Jimgerdemannia flammicorona]|uniref:Kinase-like domain-containing protein n=1 Tax=Jimgerdemannia flammicorona TaxID=994334 RepID=A0A433QXG2_9FUNG|nr:kinase-like domain-containing protein [Jimgerdemannia flammicorona]